jgi:hypothetical protein
MCAAWSSRAPPPAWSSAAGSCARARWSSQRAAGRGLVEGAGVWRRSSAPPRALVSIETRPRRCCATSSPCLGADTSSAPDGTCWRAARWVAGFRRRSPSAAWPRSPWPARWCALAGRSVTGSWSTSPVRRITCRSWGATPVRGLVLATGHFHNGILRRDRPGDRRPGGDRRGQHRPRAVLDRAVLAVGARPLALFRIDAIEIAEPYPRVRGAPNKRRPGCASRCVRSAR